MGLLLGSMDRRRWQEGVGALRAAVGVLLLGLTLVQSVHSETTCPAAAAPQSLTQPHYQDTAIGDYSGFMAPLVQSFLNTVQPNPFPKDLILRLSKELNQQLNRDLLKEVLWYQVGFLVCVAIGILYIILMPIVGFFLACCRCCGNCGGKMYQKQTSTTHCHRITLYWSAFITTVIILAGNVCMFRSNDDLKKIIDRTPAELDKTIDNIHTFLTAVPQEVFYVVNESYKTVQEVNRNLDDIGPLLGKEIQNRFRGTLDPALNSVRRLDQETVNTSLQLHMLNSSLAQLQSSVDRLQANVTAVRNRINQSLSRPGCIRCEELRPELQTLRLDTTITSPNLNEFQSSVNTVIDTNLKGQIKEAEDYFNSIPQRVTNETKAVVQSSRQQLDDIKTQISQVTNDIPLSSLNNISGTLDQVQREIDRYLPEAKRAEQIRYGVFVALCCVVLLVVVCNSLGLILGPVGLSAKADPTKRSCTADCGGTFLMMGAGFSFLFSWLFMIGVLLLFLLGGNVYTLVCRPWNNGQLLKFIDTPGLIPNFEIGQTLGLRNNINISDIYGDCKENQPLWTTLHLYELINLEDLLNVSKYTELIQQQFDNTDITLSSIVLLSPEVQKQISSFSSNAKDIDSSTITQQMNNITSINFTTTANKLDDLASLQTNGTLRTELQQEARDLREIQANIDTNITPQMESINSTINHLRSTREQINATVGEVLSNVGAAQDFLNTNTTQIVKTESRKFLDCQLAYFTVYADWANLTITQQVGRCGPVAGSVDNVVVDTLCTNIVESLNAFWFSLGWCMILFIPSIIFSIKLAKYYRKMKYSDVFDDHIIMNHIPRAQMKFT